jgi:hypothetical protein
VVQRAVDPQQHERQRVVAGLQGPRSERPIGVSTYQVKDGRFLQFVTLGDRDERVSGIQLKIAKTAARPPLVR